MENSKQLTWWNRLSNNNKWDYTHIFNRFKFTKHITPEGLSSPEIHEIYDYAINGKPLTTSKTRINNVIYITVHLGTQLIANNVSQRLLGDNPYTIANKFALEVAEEFINSPENRNIPRELNEFTYTWKFKDGIPSIIENLKRKEQVGFRAVNDTIIIMISHFRENIPAMFAECDNLELFFKKLSQSSSFAHKAHKELKQLQ